MAITLLFEHFRVSYNKQRDFTQKNIILIKQEINFMTTIKHGFVTGDTVIFKRLNLRNIFYVDSFGPSCISEVLQSTPRILHLVKVL
jgi:hypothetical protein